MGKRTSYGWRLLTCLLALLLVMGLVPVLPEAPRALAEEAGAIALGDDGAEIRAVEDEAIELGGDATAEGADELGDADSLVVGEQGEAVVLDEAVENALHDLLEPVTQ